MHAKNKFIIKNGKVYQLEINTCMNRIFVIIVVFLGIYCMTDELSLGVGNVNHPITHTVSVTIFQKLAESRGALKENWRCGREYNDIPNSPTSLCDYDFYMSYL